MARAIIRTSDATTSSAPTADARPKELDGKRLVYSDLVATDAVRLSARRPDTGQSVEPTGSMMDYSWGFDGEPFAEHVPLEIEQGQRVRLTVKNTTSMWHPIHLHGHTFRLGKETTGARKDTVNVLPGETVTVEFDADNPGMAWRRGGRVPWPVRTETLRLDLHDDASKSNPRSSSGLAKRSVVISPEPDRPPPSRSGLPLRRQRRRRRRVQSHSRRRKPR